LVSVSCVVRDGGDPETDGYGPFHAGDPYRLDRVERLGIHEGLGKSRAFTQGRLGLKPVRAVVAVQDDRAAAGNRAFDLPFEQAMGDLFAVGDLKGVDELAPLRSLPRGPPETVLSMFRAPLSRRTTNPFLKSLWLSTHQQLGMSPVLACAELKLRGCGADGG
jgi:hypothetical protein